MRRQKCCAPRSSGATSAPSRECEWLNAQDRPRAADRTDRNPALPNFTLTKLLWVREHQPEIFARIAHILCPKDYVRYRLTGKYAIDVQEASGTLLLDVAHRRWSERGGEGRRHSGELAAGALRVAGDLREDQRRRRSRDRPQRRNAGCRRRGRSGRGRGGHGHRRAGLRSRPPSEPPASFSPRPMSPRMDPLGRLHTFCHAVPGRWHVMGVTQGAGLSLRWLRETLPPAMPTTSSPRTPQRIPAGSDGVLWAPYLFGERTPHLDPTPARRSSASPPRNPRPHRAPCSKAWP